MTKRHHDVARHRGRRPRLDSRRRASLSVKLHRCSVLLSGFLPRAKFSEYREHLKLAYLGCTQPYSARDFSPAPRGTCPLELSSGQRARGAGPERRRARAHQLPPRNHTAPCVYCACASATLPTLPGPAPAYHMHTAAAPPPLRAPSRRAWPMALASVIMDKASNAFSWVGFSARARGPAGRNSASPAGGCAGSALGAGLCADARGRPVCAEACAHGPRAPGERRPPPRELQVAPRQGILG